MGKRILRKLQRQAARRTAQRRNLLHIKGGKDRDRRLAAALQQGASTLVTRLSASSAGGDRLASTEASGANARSKLTSQTDHSVGAGHPSATESAIRPSAKTTTANKSILPSLAAIFVSRVLTFTAALSSSTRI